MAQFIPVNAPNPDAAHAFIDYILRPEVANSALTYIGYYCTNKLRTNCSRTRTSPYPDDARRFRGSGEAIQNISAETGSPPNLDRISWTPAVNEAF